jgi:hypothetical protein
MNKTNFVAVALVSLLVIAGCSSGSGRNRITGSACKANDKPIPVELKGASKVSTTSVQPGNDRLGLPVGTLVFKSIDFFSETPTNTALKVVSYRGNYSKTKNAWKYGTSCARVGLKDSIETQEYLVPSKVIVSEQGRLNFDGIYIGTHTFQHKIGFKFQLQEASEQIDSFEKAFLLDSGKMEFYLLPGKVEGRDIYEIRSEAADELRGERLQFALKFVLYAPGEIIPEDLILRP